MTSQLPSASPNPASAFTWKPNATGLTLVKLKNRVPCVVVPSKVDGVPVMVVGAKAFYRVAKLESIWLPDSIVTLEEESFYWCSKLKQVRFSQGLRSIGKGALNFANR